MLVREVRSIRNIRLRNEQSCRSVEMMLEAMRYNNKDNKMPAKDQRARERLSGTEPFCRDNQRVAEKMCACAAEPCR
jgi:hypothetical protein